MLTTGGLLGASIRAGRRQGWSWWPLFVASVLGRLLGLMPTVFLFARFLRRGLAMDSSNADLAVLLGAFSEDDPKLVGEVAGLGAAIAIAGSWLLATVVGAGVLRQLAAQAGQVEKVSDDAFADGVLASPGRYLITGLIAEALKLFVSFGALGAVLAGGWYFLDQPGVGSSLAMTVALGMIVIIPAMVAALEIGFARSVILGEGPIAALGEGLLLTGRRVSQYLPAWYVFAFAEVVFGFAVGMARLVVGSVPSEHDLWILGLGPIAVVWLAGVAAETLVQFGRLGVAAVLVAEDAGMMPEPAQSTPPPSRIEPVFKAHHVEPEIGEMVIEAQVDEAAVEKPKGEV